MPVFIAPVAGRAVRRISGRALLATGLGLQAIGLGWLAAVTSPTVPYLTLVPAFVVSGVGMSLFFAPVANVVLGSVRRDGVRAPPCALRAHPHPCARPALLSWRRARSWRTTIRYPGKLRAACHHRPREPRPGGRRSGASPVYRGGFGLRGGFGAPWSRRTITRGVPGAGLVHHRSLLSRQA